LIKPLESLAKQHPLEATRSGADELRIAIKTQGFVFESKRPSEQKNEFRQAWKELEDPLVPVQGHGLLTLSNLLRRKDVEALQHKKELLKIFLATLEHEDSYIYLIGIQALTALADVYTEEVLTALIQQLEDVILVGNSSPKLIVEVDSEVPSPAGNRLQRPSEVRLKVGEALLKVVRLIGPLVPQYKGPLLHAFLRGTKDEDAFVRVSALQNLGELCGLLRYSLGSIVHEVIDLHYNWILQKERKEKKTRKKIRTKTLAFERAKSHSKIILCYLVLVFTLRHLILLLRSPYSWYNSTQFNVYIPKSFRIRSFFISLSIIQLVVNESGFNYNNLYLSRRNSN